MGLPRRSVLAFAGLLAVAHGTSGTSAWAQPMPVHRPPPPQTRTPDPPPPVAAAEAAPTNLRGRFGLEAANRLIASANPNDRLRGLERVVATHTPEALVLLERAAGRGTETTPLEETVAKDSRALLVLVHGLASWADREPARKALDAILSHTQAAPRDVVHNLAAGALPDPAADQADSVGRVLLARQEAAMALARTEEAGALEKLLAAARSNGPGQAPALDALAAYPPATALLSGVALTTPATIALAVDAGDLRSLGAIFGAVHASDPSLRAAAIAALGRTGDSRVLEVAHEAGKDKEARIRVAGADALVHLGAPDAAQAVEALIGDDATVREGLRLARDVQGEGLTKAAAARAAAAADAELRSLAIVALGRQASPAAVTALAVLAADARVGGDAMEALARSPSPAAMGALDAMAAVAASRRVAARAYFVRRMVRGERSATGDALLAALAAGADGADRAVGMEALVALGERSLEAALQDRDPRVRRAAAMAAGARLDDRRTTAILLAQLASEQDAATREVLAAALADGDPEGTIPTATLVDRAEGGGADAPLAALALARRADDSLEPKVNALLASRNAVMRAHVARGLAESSAPDAVGRLAEAYAWEPAREVRRALVRALAAHAGAEAEAPSRTEALQLAASLEPDAVTRDIAQRALEGLRPHAPPVGREVAWLHVVPAEGAKLPQALTGALASADAPERPVVFDDDGYALVPGLPPGDMKLRLETRLPSDASP